MTYIANQTLTCNAKRASWLLFCVLDVSTPGPVRATTPAMCSTLLSDMDHCSSYYYEIELLPGPYERCLGLTCVEPLHSPKLLVRRASWRDV
jgi:hypothetical protein